jgi:N-acetylglucosaminyl-diphospho-decaprenol L-rhamnosyltransferase
MAERPPAAASMARPGDSPVVIPPPAAVQNREESEPDLVVIVVTFNSAKVIPAFLDALPGALEGVRTASVYVADNGSADDTVAQVQHRTPWVRVRETGRNLGYAGGINHVLREKAGRLGVLVLNPDAIPAAGFARHLLAAVEGGAGIAVPRIVDDRGNLKFSLRREPTIRRALGEAVLGGHRAARFERWGDQIRDPAYYVDGAAPDWASGAAMLISRRVLDAVGLWDESFFLYSEETDYALRARNAGFGVRFVPAAEVVHPGGDMSRSAWLWSLVAVNRVRLYARNHNRTASAAYWVVAVLNEALRAAWGSPTHRAALGALLRRRPPLPPA